MLWRDPDQGKMGWFNVERVIPRERVLWVAAGRPNSDESSVSWKSL
jgi:hypothetical protein